MNQFRYEILLKMRNRLHVLSYENEPWKSLHLSVKRSAARKGDIEQIFILCRVVHVYIYINCLFGFAVFLYSLLLSFPLSVFNRVLICTLVVNLSDDLCEIKHLARC